MVRDAARQPLGAGRLHRLAAAALRVASQHPGGDALAPALLGIRLQAPAARWLSSGAPVAGASPAPAAAARPAKDPERPRPPATVFMLFSKEMRPTLPKMAAPESAKQLSERWWAMTEEEKRPYVATWNRRSEEYGAEMAEYRASGKEAMWAARSGSARKAAFMDPHRPKMPPNAFALFVAATGALGGGYKTPQEASATWSAMSDRDKAVYVEEAEAKKEAYHEQMREYKDSGRHAEWKAMVKKVGTTGDASQRFIAELQKSMPARSRRSPVDPARPKKPMGAFFLFQREVKDRTSSAKAAGEMWRAMSDEEKAPYMQEAAELMREYRERLAEYKTSGQEASWAAAQAAPAAAPEA